MPDLLFKINRHTFLHKILRQFLGIGNGFFQATIGDMLPQDLVDVFLSTALGKLLNKSSLHDNELILQRNVSILAHIESDDEGFNLFVVCLEIFQGDLIKSIQDLVVLRCVLHKLLKHSIIGFFVHFIIALSGERARDRQIDPALIT